jgi:hypothetical protein
MLVIDNKTAAEIERLSDKMSHILERVVSLGQLDPMASDGSAETAMMTFAAEMYELGGQSDVRRAYELFKNIANMRTDIHMLRIYPELVKLRRMLDMSVRNEFGPYDDPPSDEWVGKRIDEYESAVKEILREEDMLKGESNG